MNAVASLFLVFAFAQTTFLRKYTVEPNVFRCENGTLTIKSQAPLETISAKSKSLRGAVDPGNNTFAWVVEMRTFEGFNNPLQREHFNENYMESKTYPKATFSGKIIEKVDLSQDGNHQVRAKGKLLIHGVENERIIKCNLSVKGKQISVRSDFSVFLNDHSISIPKIVNQKISEEVLVEVEAVLTKN